MNNLQLFLLFISGTKILEVVLHHQIRS